MFSLDNSFLEKVGLGSLPDEQKKEFLSLFRSQLEERVGEKLYQGLNEAQTNEFEKIIDQDELVIDNWLATNSPDYKNDIIFKNIMKIRQLPIDSLELKIEYTSTKWIEKNRPDYREVVQAEIESIQKEIEANKDAILGESSTN